MSLAELRFQFMHLEEQLSPSSKIMREFYMKDIISVVWQHLNPKLT